MSRELTSLDYWLIEAKIEVATESCATRYNSAEQIFAVNQA